MLFFGDHSKLRQAPEYTGVLRFSSAGNIQHPNGEYADVYVSSVSFVSGGSVLELEWTFMDGAKEYEYVFVPK